MPHVLIIKDKAKIAVIGLINDMLKFETLTPCEVFLWGWTKKQVYPTKTTWTGVYGHALSNVPLDMLGTSEQMKKLKKKQLLGFYNWVNIIKVCLLLKPSLYN